MHLLLDSALEKKAIKKTETEKVRRLWMRETAKRRLLFLKPEKHPDFVAIYRSMKLRYKSNRHTYPHPMNDTKEV